MSVYLYVYIYIYACVHLKQQRNIYIYIIIAELRCPVGRAFGSATSGTPQQGYIYLYIYIYTQHVRIFTNVYIYTPIK